MNEILPHLRRTVLRSDGAGMTDGELLDCFVWAAGQAAPGVISTQVAALTEGVLKTMLLTKLKLATGVFLMACAAGMGTGGLIYRATAANPTAQAAPPAVD
jgi:hypothetical protein